MVFSGALGRFTSRPRLNAAVAILSATLFFYLAYSPMDLNQAKLLIPFFLALSSANFVFLKWVYKYLGWTK